MKQRKHPQLMQAWHWWHDMVEIRKRHLLRISSAERGVSNYDPDFERDKMESFQLDAYVDKALKIMVEQGKMVGPVWDWMTGIKGIGDSLAAQVLALIDDIGKFDTISKLWRYSGYGIYYYWVDGKGKVMAPRDGYKYNKAKEERERVVAKPKESWALVQRPDVGVPGWLLPFSRPIKSVLWNVAKQFVMQQTSLYVEFYYEKKVELRTKYPEKIVTNGKTKYNDGHIDNMAKRKMKKLFLSHLWLKWREFEGLPVTEPYVKAVLGHTNITVPP